MKKFWAFLVVGLLIGSAAWAVDVQISAIVASRLSVGITDSTWDLTIDNTGAEVTQDSIDNLTVISSKKNYTVSFSSSDNGNLKMTVSGTDYLIPYKIKVDTSSWSEGVQTNNLDTYKQLTEAKTIVFIKRTPAAGKAFLIGIQIPAYSEEIYEDGTYTATLTIDITAS